MTLIFPQDRKSLRAFYREAWRKHQAGDILQPLESQVAQVVAEHPEYPQQIEADDDSAEFTPEQGQSNPFLHMGMHLAIREQVGTNRPFGIADVHQRLAIKHGNAGEAEHRMMECLGEALWSAQRNNAPPDEQAYLNCLRKL